MNTKHIAFNCNVKGCKQEAEYWIDTKDLSGDFDLKNHTFYLCLEHATSLSMADECEYISFLNPETGKIREVEVAVYSCSENCKVCN